MIYCSFYFYHVYSCNVYAYVTAMELNDQFSCDDGGWSFGDMYEEIYEEGGGGKWAWNNGGGLHRYMPPTLAAVCRSI